VSEIAYIENDSNWIVIYFRSNVRRVIQHLSRLGGLHDSKEG